MANHFNELLLQTLKEVGIRLERLEGRVDHVINEKSDKADVKDVKADVKDVKADVRADIKDVKADVEDVKADVKALSEKLDTKADKADVKDVKADLTALRDEVRSHGQRLDRIDTGIRTLQWTMTAGIAAMGIILAFVKAC
jgi:predicted  nucleic acid-binding Zn-ribbon protein